MFLFVKSLELHPPPRGSHCCWDICVQSQSMILSFGIVCAVFVELSPVIVVSAVECVLQLPSPLPSFPMCPASYHPSEWWSACYTPSPPPPPPLPSFPMCPASYHPSERWSACYPLPLSPPPPLPSFPMCPASCHPNECGGVHATPPHPPPPLPSFPMCPASCHPNECGGVHATPPPPPHLLYPLSLCAQPPVIQMSVVECMLHPPPHTHTPPLPSFPMCPASYHPSERWSACYPPPPLPPPTSSTLFPYVPSLLSSK